MTVSLLLRIGVLASVVASTWYEQPSYLWVSLLLIGLFVIKGLVWARRDAERVDALADHTYFLAYSATISAALGMTARVYVDGQLPNDLGPVEVVGGIALLTTLVGVVGMVTLKEYAQRLSEDEPPADPPALTAKPTTAPDDIAAARDEIRHISNEAISHIAQVVDRFKAVGPAVDSLISTLEGGRERAKAFTEDIDDMHGALDEWERLRERVLDRDEVISGAKK